MSHWDEDPPTGPDKNTAAWMTHANEWKERALAAERGRDELLKGAVLRTAQLERLANLRHAATAVYQAAHWTADRPVDSAALWTALRDAIGLPAGTSPRPDLTGDRITRLLAEERERCATLAFRMGRERLDIGYAETMANAIAHRIRSLK